MNLKKSIAVGFAVTALFASFGCGGGGGTEGRTGSPQAASTQQKKPLDEATIKSLAKKMESSNIAERKEAILPENLPAYTFIKTPLKDESAVFFNQIAKFENLSVSNIQQEGDIASAKVSYIGADKKQHSEEWYFRRLEGKWYGDFNGGIQSAKHLQVSGIDGAALEAAANIGYTYENEPILALDVRSKTAAVYQLGRWGHPSYILITDKGEFPLQNTARLSVNPSFACRITSAQPFRFYLPFKGATGTPKALRIVGFNELDSRGLPLNHAHDDTVTFTLSE